MTSLSTFGTIFNTVWSLIFIAPLYIILSTVLTQALLHFNQLSRDRSYYIYKYLGDVSWLIPFNKFLFQQTQQFVFQQKQNQKDVKSTQILLVAITLVILSILFLAFMLFRTHSENKYQQTKARLLEQIRNKSNQNDSTNDNESKEDIDQEDEQSRKQFEKRQEASDKMTSDQKKKRKQELEEMQRKQEQMLADEKKYKEERRKKIDQKNN